MGFHWPERHTHEEGGKSQSGSQPMGTREGRGFGKYGRCGYRVGG